MVTFGLAFLVLIAAAGALSIGLLAGRPPVAGSCGGLGCSHGTGGCAACAEGKREDPRQ